MGIDARMFVRHRGRMSEQDIRRLSAEVCKRFNRESFMVDREGKYGPPSHALKVVKEREWHQDGETIVAGPDEEFIEVNLFTRYYGPGYERGNWGLIRGVAEFLEIRIPGSEVWYGGDSSGVCASLFDLSAREAINRHFLTHGHEPYRGYKGSYSRAKTPQLCDFCGGIEMHDSGGGGDHVFWSCDGCGLKRVSSPRGTWDLTDKEDFFGFVEPTGKAS